MHTKDVLAGAGLGAALAFILDPDRGARRRALVRDKMALATRKTREGLDATARDVTNRARGAAAAARGRLAGGPVEDDVLAERVRARLGRVCSHPRAVDVLAREGEITLRGPVLSREVQQLIHQIERVPGVGRVINELEPHESGEGVPSLQGGRAVQGAQLDILQPRWAPATRALVGAGVVATGMYLASHYARPHRS